MTTLSSNSNIYVGYQAGGGGNESNVLRVGNGTGTGSGNLNKAFISGIFGITASGGTAVFINNSDQLGTATSSIRYKENVQEMGDVSSIIQALRPVSFNYINDDQKCLEWGLIAEEVEQIIPTWVVGNKEGRPETVRYQMLPIFLLKEVQRQRKEIDALKAKLDS